MGVVGAMATLKMEAGGDYSKVSQEEFWVYLSKEVIFM